MLQRTEKDFRDYVQLANKRLKDPIANMFTGEMETKDDVYKELENQYNDEEQRTIEAARAANVQSGATNDQRAVLPGGPKDNEPGGPGISADAGEQTEASPGNKRRIRIRSRYSAHTFGTKKKIPARSNPIKAWFPYLVQPNKQEAPRSRRRRMEPRKELP